jgi:hypothetical protein
VFFNRLLGGVKFQVQLDHDFELANFRQLNTFQSGEPEDLWRVHGAIECGVEGFSPQIRRFPPRGWRTANLFSH